MMLFHLEFANIIRLALAELFQTVGGLFNGFVSIRSNLFTINVYTRFIFALCSASSVVAAELFKFIRYTAVDVTVANIIW